MDIFINEFFKLSLDQTNVMITVMAPGYEIKEFAKVTEVHPRIKLTGYGALSKALMTADRKAVMVGVWRDKIELELSKDEMAAYIRLNMTAAEIKMERQSLGNEIIALLNGNDIRNGILREIFTMELEPGQKTMVAEGIPAVHGVDAEVRYYQMEEKKPVMKTDGSVNHYELNLIDQVFKGNWLGEKIPPTEGKPGVTVNGKPLKPKDGRDKRLKYDAKTVEEKDEGDRIILIAKVNGAVRYRDGKVAVDNHLVIGGNVDYSTGNIDFDGFITIEGTVEDGFIVVADRDITINGEMGIGAVGRIESRSGSILIKGGVNGKGTAEIVAFKNIFVKFSNEANLTAGQSINVGLYALDSILKSKKVYAHPQVGKLIGGEIYAEHQVVTGSIGNKSEKKTLINVKGFERLNVKDELDSVLERYKELIKEADAIRRQLEVFEANMSRLDEKAVATYKMLSHQYEGFLDEALKLNDRILELQEILKTRGEGEVKVLQTVYPKTMLEIKNMQRRVKEMTTGSFYVKDRNMHFEDN